MDETILTAISTVGFPIVACITMFFLNKSQSEQHSAEIKELTGVINELKVVISEMKERLTKI